MKRLIGYLTFTATLFSVQAQNCSQLLSRAEDNYEAGRLLAILKEDPSALDFIECIGLKGDLQFTKEEEVRARKLLTKVYIFTDNEALAEIALVGLLKSDPEHILDPQDDPSELLYLMQQFRTAPIFRLGLRGGFNICSPSVFGNFSPSNIPKFFNGKTTEGDATHIDYKGNEYSPELSYSVGLMGEAIVERKLYQGLDAMVGVQFRTSKYNIESYVNSTIKSEIVNNQTYLRLPVGLKYTLWNADRSKSLLPYAFMGASGDYLIAAFYEISRTGGIPYTVTKNDDGGNLIESRSVNRRSYSYYAGLGAKLRIKTHFLTLDFRYDAGQTNYIKSNNRYNGDNKAITFDSVYSEDNLSLNLWSLAIGYTYSVHYPRKLKQYR